jgi:hypothetical protein
MHGFSGLHCAGDFDVPKPIAERTSAYLLTRGIGRDGQEGQVAG